MIRPLVVGNWKMNGLAAGLAEATAIAEAAPRHPADVMLCPPATLIERMARTVAGRIKVGGQDCHHKSAGAYTGDISAEMLRDAGAAAVILGHSERRTDHAEGSALVRAKASVALAAGLDVIVCVGETAGERSAGLTMEVVRRQVAQSVPDVTPGRAIVIAYEPVWAIGTGLVPTTGDVAAVHAGIRDALVTRYGDGGRGMRILYGGSVKPANAAELMAVANVNGALVGGASLKAADFLGILAAYHA